MYREHIGWTSSKLITGLISLGSSLLEATTSAIKSKGNTPKIRVELGWGRSSQQKTCNISETGQDRTKVTIDDHWPTGSRIRPSIGAQINDLGWPWRAITHSVSNHVRLSKPTTKIWMKIDPYYQLRRCSPMTLDSGSIRFMWIFTGVPGEGTSNDSGIIENVDFRAFGRYFFGTLGNEARPLLLSPIHWHQNIWSWMAFLRSFFNFHFYESRLSD